MPQHSMPGLKSRQDAPHSVFALAITKGSEALPWGWVDSMHVQEPSLPGADDCPPDASYLLPINRGSLHRVSGRIQPILGGAGYVALNETGAMDPLEQAEVSGRRIGQGIGDPQEVALQLHRPGLHRLVVVGALAAAQLLEALQPSTTKNCNALLASTLLHHATRTDTELRGVQAS